MSTFLGNDYVRMLRSADPDLTVHTVLLDGGNEPGTESWSTFVAAGGAVESGEVEHRIAAIKADDTAYLLFTSGTSGKPKAVGRTHGQNLHFTRIMIDRFELSSDEHVYLVLPLFHMFGLAGGFLMNMAAGGSVVLADVFDAEAVMRKLQDEHVTFLLGPPTVFRDILTSARRDQYDLSSLRKALLRAAAVSRELVERMLSEGLVDTAFSAYGLTEALVVACSKPGDPPELTAEWSGCALPGVEIELRSESGDRAAIGEPGEILVRSAMVMKGYLDDPDASSAALDSGGWLHTGDIGVMNEAGYLRVTDRKKDMITVGGFNVYPAEVEAILSEHPAVAQVAVVSKPDERMGEVPVAFVIRREDQDTGSDELISWSRQNMANYKVPRHVEFVESLPTTASMKVRKDVLRERLRSTPDESAC